MKYKYFISFMYQTKTDMGYANNTINTTRKIDEELIQEIIQNLIDKNGYLAVTILNFIQLKK